MKLTKVNAIALLTAIGFANVEAYPDAKLLEKINKLPSKVDVDDLEGSMTSPTPEAVKILKSILAAVEDKEEVEIVEEKAPKAEKPAAKGKAKPAAEDDDAEDPEPAEKPAKGKAKAAKGKAKSTGTGGVPTEIREAMSPIVLKIAKKGKQFTVDTLDAAKPKGATRSHCRRLLRLMAKAGQISKVGRGTYEAA